MTDTIDIDSIDRLISNAGLGSFELNTDISIKALATRRAKPKPQPQRISQDFLLDLDVAGRHVIGAIADLVHSERGLTALMFALDATPTGKRPHDLTRALTNILNSFVDPKTALRFLPAVNTIASETTGGVHSLPQECACAIDTELTTIYSSANLGFRDLFHATQTAAIKSLILWVEPLGILKDPVVTLSAISNLLNSDMAAPKSDVALEEIRMGTPIGDVDAYALSFHRDI